MYLRQIIEVTEIELVFLALCQLKRAPTKINWIIANNSRVSETRLVIVIFK